jgi:hypothetical protein
VPEHSIEVLQFAEVLLIKWPVVNITIRHTNLSNVKPQTIVAYYQPLKETRIYEAVRFRYKTVRF